MEAIQLQLLKIMILKAYMDIYKNYSILYFILFYASIKYKIY